MLETERQAPALILAFLDTLKPESRVLTDDELKVVRALNDEWRDVMFELDGAVTTQLRRRATAAIEAAGAGVDQIEACLKILPGHISDDIHRLARPVRRTSGE